MHGRTGTLIACLLCAAPVQAQERTGAEPAIVVLGAPLALPPGTPAYGATVVDRDRLASEASGRVENALKTIAGFSQFRRSDSRSANPSAQGANLRALGGNASSRTLLLLDGVPMADPFFGYLPYNAIVPERLAEVRVTPGGGTGAFGAGAVAGMIEMASATRRDLPLLSASALYGSRNAQELTATLSPDLGAGFLSLSGRYEQGDGFNTTPASQIVSATVPAAYESWSVSARAVAPVGAGQELQARLLVYRDDRTLRFAGADSHAEGQDASIRFLARGPWQVDALAYVQARNFSNRVINSSAPFRRSLDQRDTPALGLGGKIELRPPVGRDHLLRIGIDARRASGIMVEDAYANAAGNPLTARRRATGNQLTAGAFLEDDWTIGPLVLTAGARIDRWTIGNARLESRDAAGVLTLTPYPERSGWEGGGRAGLLWRASDALAFRAAAYTGFRLPTLNELYRPFRVGADATAANAGLANERLKGVEAGIDLSPVRGLRLSGTVFLNRLDNAIANVTVARGPFACFEAGAVSAAGTCRQRRNVRAIEVRGVELSASARTGPFTLDASYAFDDARVEAPGTPLDRLRPAQSATHSASATLAWAPRSGHRLSATLRYAGAQFEDDLNIDRLPDALTVDTFAAVPLGLGFSLVGRAENLFDATVYTRRVSSPTLSEDLGAPRTLWIGLRFGG